MRVYVHTYFSDFMDGCCALLSLLLLLLLMQLYML